MLPASARLRRSSDIGQVMRHGRRLSSRLLVLHVLDGTDQPSRFAFAVGKNVGNSVIRHRVTRKLREIVRTNGPSLPAGSLVVVRALPGCAQASFAVLTESFTYAASRVGQP